MSKTPHITITATSFDFEFNGATVTSIDENGKLTLDSGTGVDEFSIDGTLTGNSDDAVPTEKAVKTYIDTNTNTNITYITTSAATYTLNETSDCILFVGADSTITLDTDMLSAQVLITIIVTGDFTVIVDTEGAELISGENSKTLTQYDAMDLCTDTTNYYIK